MIALALVSTFLTTGGTISSGNRLVTLPTLDWISLNATSISLSKLNVMLTTETPGEDSDFIDSIPGVVFTASSIILVIL